MIATKPERDLIVEMLGRHQISSLQARMLFDAIEHCREDEMQPMPEAELQVPAQGIFPKIREMLNIRFNMALRAS